MLGHVTAAAAADTQRAFGGDDRPEPVPLQFVRVIAAQRESESASTGSWTPMLDEFALTLHLRDVYWTREGRHSIEVSIVWMLLGCLLLVGISPFGIRDQSEIPRAIGFAIVAVNIVLSLITCLKGKLTLGLLSISCRLSE